MTIFKNISWEQKDGTGILTMKRPDVYNALTREAKLEFICAIEAAGKESAVKSIVITGEGKAFSSGQDLNDRAAGKEEMDLGKVLETEWNPLVKAIRNCSKIVIGAINGVCAGAGVSIALACDLLIAPAGVKFVSGFSKLGLVPDAGSTFTIVRALGYQKALEFFLFNRPLYSEDLLKAGLLNSIEENPFAASLHFTRQINSMAPLSVQAIKNNAQQAQEVSFAESMRYETNAQRTLGHSLDYKEGVRAFIEKRTAVFCGR